jgi:hypothetical protein
MVPFKVFLSRFHLLAWVKQKFAYLYATVNRGAVVSDVLVSYTPPAEKITSASDLNIVMSI